MTRSIVVTGCDLNHYVLVEDLIASLRDGCGAGVEIGFIHIGEDPIPASIAERVDRIAHVPDGEFRSMKPKGLPLAFLNVKPRIPEFFPGFDVYVWLDGDTWVQNPLGLDQLIEASRYADVCMHPEKDPNYRLSGEGSRQYLLSTYTAIYGPDEAAHGSSFSDINAGVFAAAAASPLWPLWKAALEDVRARSRDRDGVYFSDQIPLHRLLVSGQLSLAPLRAVNNWLALFATPAINLQRRRLLAPSYPFEEINIIHLAGESKNMRFTMPDGSAISLRYREIKALFATGGPP
jgi:hypothetical protein